MAVRDLMGRRAPYDDRVFAAGLPTDLVELQRRVLTAEAVYRDRVAALYAHPVMRDARVSGRLPEIEQVLRCAAREPAAA